MGDHQHLKALVFNPSFSYRPSKKIILPLQNVTKKSSKDASPVSMTSSWAIVCHGHLHIFAFSPIRFTPIGVLANAATRGSLNADRADGHVGTTLTVGLLEVPELPVLKMPEWSLVPRRLLSFRNDVHCHLDPEVAHPVWVSPSSWGFESWPSCLSFSLVPFPHLWHKSKCNRTEHQSQFVLGCLLEHVLYSSNFYISRAVFFTGLTKNTIMYIYLSATITRV